jgi:NitT/TauT family transport system substrate-binding protein
MNHSKQFSDLAKLLFAAFIALSLSLSGCSSQPDPLKISVNKWVGYSPLIYAEKQGWLKEDNISLAKTVSLGESLNLYLNGITQGFTGTQHEYYVAKKSNPNVKAAMFLDHSFGGDAVLSNVSLNTLKNLSEINVYLEIGTINEDILKDFITAHHLQHLKLNLNGTEQANISTLSTNISPTLIITYSPYTETLLNKGFHLLASTRNLDIFVLDALYVTEATFQQHQQQVYHLKDAIQKALETLQSNPKKYYQAVNGFLGYTNYEEFLASTQQIKWILHPDSNVLERIQQSEVEYLPSAIDQTPEKSVQ